MSVAAFDLDGTLIEQNSSFSFCRFLYSRAILTRSDLLYCSALYFSYLFFGLDLHALHSRAFKRVFRGKSIAALQPHIAPFIETLTWYQPALDRLNQLRKSGYEIYILSNSPLFLVRPLAASIGVENVVATDYEIDKAGRLWNIATLVDGEKKRQILQGLNKKTIAFSDSHHDLPFLEGAAQAIAVAPTRRLLKVAKARDWEVLSG